MSGKGGRVRRTRRTNTHDEENPEVKLDDSIEQSDDNKSTKSNDTEKLDTSFSKEETNGHDTTTTITEESPTEEQPVVTEKTNGQPEIIIADPSPIEKEKNGDDEIEPISVDSEDPELQFTSEVSDKSEEMSPTLNRCRTRRSHTRNLPTPKTPKLPEVLNGEATEEKEKEIVIIPEEPEECSENVSLASNISIDGSFEEKTLDTDLADASIFVNLGNDTTKNFDITIQSNLEMDDEPSHFLETTKDKSYGETLRCLTGRKTSRNITNARVYSSSIELSSKDFTDSSRKYTPSFGGIKRKLDAESPSDKRMRTEDVSPGILSYLTSPFKNKIGQSSTPKLTGFKFNHGSSVIDEVSKVDEDKPEPRKWCSIM